MAKPEFLIAPTALHVDVPDEAGARAILAAVVAAGGLDVRRVRWAPYAKLGPHSRLSFFVTIPTTDEGAAVTEVDRICTLLSGRDGRTGRVTDFRDEATGARHYNRTMKRGLDGDRFFPGTHWFDIELETYGPVQARLRGELARAVSPDA